MFVIKNTAGKGFYSPTNYNVELKKAAIFYDIQRAKRVAKVLNHTGIGNGKHFKVKTIGINEVE